MAPGASRAHGWASQVVSVPNGPSSECLCVCVCVCVSKAPNTLWVDPRTRSALRKTGFYDQNWTVNHKYRTYGIIVKVFPQTLLYRTGKYVQHPVINIIEKNMNKNCAYAKLLSPVWLFGTPWTVACQAPLSPWDSPSKNTGMGCLSLLQGIFPTQGWNPGLLPCRRILYRLS